VVAAVAVAVAAASAAAAAAAAGVVAVAAAVATGGDNIDGRASADRRSADAATARASCYRCFKPRVACICSAIRRVDNRTGITILQHPRERFHALGTVRIARLGLTRARVEWCAPWEDAAAIRDRLPAGAALLYPSPAARALTTLPASEYPRHLVAIDGTWFLAKKIYDAHSWLHRLPHVSLTPTRPSAYRIRREPQPHCLATLEGDRRRPAHPGTRHPRLRRPPGRVRHHGRPSGGVRARKSGGVVAP
jgi:DTW domain-containing protein YfiP